MQLRITGDINQGSGVETFLYKVSSTTSQHFRGKDYGAGQIKVGIVLMCRDPHLNFKQRIRFAKKENTLYVDIMIDLNQMLKCTQEQRNSIISREIIRDVSSTLPREKKSIYFLAFSSTGL
jgi:hypothetical protein